MPQDISAEDLAIELKKHTAWLAGTGGERLSLAAKLPPGFDLRGARLNHADLSGSDLQEAQCDNTVFYDALLRNANLKGCTGLNSAQLAGADLAGAQLPEDIVGFELLK